MERIYVTVRARPLSPEDAKSSPWRICDNSISYPNQPHKLEFDRICGEDCITRDVNEARTREIVGAAVRGFNGTAFAYVQTSSGKTHTMRGSSNELGVGKPSFKSSILFHSQGREHSLQSKYGGQPQMRFVKHQSSTTHQMQVRPPRVETRASAGPGKRWVCKSLDLEGGKRSLGPLPGEVSKNPSRPSHRLGFFQMKQGAAKKEHGGSGGLKKR